MSELNAANLLLNLNQEDMPPVLPKMKPPSKELKNAVLNLMLVELRTDCSMDSTNGGGNYGYVTTLIKKWQLQYPWVNRNIFNYTKQFTHLVHKFWKLDFQYLLFN